MPITPRPTSGSVTGTSGAVQLIGPWCDSRAGSRSTTSLGVSAVPTRATIQSGWPRRRSHSRARGPVAISRTSAGSGASVRRAVRSTTSAWCASSSIARVRSSCSATWVLYRIFWLRRPWVKFAIIITGDIATNISVYGERVIAYMPAPMKIGAITIRNGSGIFSGRVGSRGRLNSVLRGSGSSRGGRL